MGDIAGLAGITAVSIGAFLVAFWLAGIADASRRVIATVRQALKTMRDPEADELQRERTVQAAAVKLVVASASIIFRSTLALAVAFVPVLGADWAGISPVAVTLDFMERWDVITIASLMVTLAYVLWAKLCPR